jgi:methionyl-tRNA formyltransferase
MRIVLFGLTGFGNAALRGCHGAAEVVACFTRQEAGPFPYYPERPLAAEARAAGIPVVETAPEETPGAAGGLRALAPDLVLVATYHRRIPAAWLAGVPGGGINLHPSLLPAYRGPTPTAWCLANGETETGLTAHVLTEQFDEGPILLQRRVPIAREDTDGTLRRRLAGVAEAVARELVRRLGWGEPLTGVPQAAEGASRQPKRTARDAEIGFDQPGAAVYNRIRASLPVPGPTALLGGRPIRILGAALRPAAGSALPGDVLEAGPGWLDVRTRDGAIRLRVAEEAPADAGAPRATG